MKSGQDFGAFTLLERIGKGGMASVYMATQKSLGRKVVLKIMHSHLADDESLVARFEREARLAARLNHVNIVQVLDSGRFADSWFIAMEYIEGWDLQKWTKEHGTPPLEIAVVMLRDICRGLRHAHHHGLIHRDIKPANVMFSKEGTIKLMDFGLARRGEDDTSMTQVGTILGTAAYMSPEQASGEGTIDERSDLFSLGIMGFEILGGDKPFPGKTYSSVIRQILTVEPPSLAELNPLVSDSIVWIINRLLKKKPQDRYASIDDALDDIEGVIDELHLFRGADLLREFAADPERVRQVLRSNLITRSLETGKERMLEGDNEGAGRMFRGILFLQPDHDEARDALVKLEEGSASGPREAEVDDKTQILPAGPRGSGVGGKRTSPPSRVGRSGSATTSWRSRTSSVPAKSESSVDTDPSGSHPAPSSAIDPTSSSTSHVGPVPVPRRVLRVLAAVLPILIVAGVVWALADRDIIHFPWESDRGDGRVDTSSTPVTPPAPTPSTNTSTPHVASLEVTSSPGNASIVLDGFRRPERTPAKFESLSVGKHAIRVEREGYVAKESVVELVAGETSTASFSLRKIAPTTGILDITVRPYAAVFVDGSLRSKDRPRATIEVSVGTHDVRAVPHPQFEPKDWKDVKVNPGATVKLSHDFMANVPATLRITSGGIWARVYVNGVDTGKTTPCVIEGLAAGSYRVRLERPGFVVDGGERPVKLDGGDDKNVSFTLRPSS